MTVEAPELSPRERIWQVVAAIPEGKVCSYGQVARLAGLGRAARMVGRTLRELPEDTRLPWHRVVNAQGEISLPPGSPGYREQRARLREEGIRFRPNGSLSLVDHGYRET